MSKQEVNKMYIGDVTFQGHVARSAYSRKIVFENEFASVEWILNPDQLFFTSADASYDATEDYYYIELSAPGMAKSTRLFTNAEEEGDGIRELIRKTDVSEAADIWHFQEIIENEVVRRIATKPGKAFHLGVNYLLTYHETEEPT